MYNFHASSNAYMQHWNDSYGQTTPSVKLSRKQVWQAFVQESIRSVASASKVNFEANQNSSIDHVFIQFCFLSNANDFLVG